MKTLLISLLAAIVLLVAALAFLGGSASNPDRPSSSTPSVTILKRDYRRWGGIYRESLVNGRHALAAGALANSRWWRERAEHAQSEQETDTHLIRLLETHQ